MMNKQGNVFSQQTTSPEKHPTSRLGEVSQFRQLVNKKGKEGIGSVSIPPSTQIFGWRRDKSYKKIYKGY
jgi:hypothetical protein